MNLSIGQENVTEVRLREIPQNDAFCTSLNGDNEFYRSDSGLLYKINENIK